MKKMIKILKWFGIILLLIVVGFILFVQFNSDKKWDAPYPEIVASKDSTIIARGKYLVYGPAHCGTCHVPVNKLEPLLSKQFEVDVRPVLLIVQVKPLSVDIAKPLLLAP